MNWFYNLKTSAKLILSFVIVALILAAVGIYGMNNLKKMNGEVDSMYDSNLIPIGDMGSIRKAYLQIRLDVRDMNILASTDAENIAYEDSINNNISEIERLIEKYSLTYLTQPEKDELAKFAPIWEKYKSSLDEVVQINKKNASVEVFKSILTAGFKTIGEEMQANLDNLITLNIQQGEVSRHDSGQLYSSSRNLTIIVIILSLLLCIGFGYFIARVISKPLNRMVNLVGSVANGDLRQTSDITTKDEVGQLAVSVNEMVLSLRTTIGGILGSAESVSAASQQISASTEEIAGGSASQADSAQTMSELFKELSYAINSVAQSAEQASELSERTMSIAQDGGKVVRISINGMNKVNEQMSRLEEDSNKIGEIIDVIDDIAEQTNLLALNAAIEAARAGDQGRGFAVVADEVRKLAERSSEATKQITKIIKGMQVNTQQSVLAVEEGVSTSQKTGEAFDNIITMVSESALKVSEIAAASEEQAAQSSEVMNAIETISAATEEAAASSEETASTAQSLAQLAEELNSSVMTFKLN